MAGRLSACRTLMQQIFLVYCSLNRQKTRMNAQFPRTLLQTAAAQLAFSPAIVLLGPRQVGKTTLAKTIAAGFPGAVSLDLQLAGDREKLINGSGFLQAHRDRLVEIGRASCRERVSVLV